jgi:hypothetical protein
MQRMSLKMLAIALFMTSASYGQSLGDVARENRERKIQDASSATPRVITNKDLQKDPDASPESPEGQSGTDAVSTATSSTRADQRAANQSAKQSLAEQRQADQWKKQILAQKSRMAVLQTHIDQLNESMRSSGGSVQYEPPYNRYQARQLLRISQVQRQLDEQKLRLLEMQEAARRAGMHTAVYDP